MTFLFVKLNKKRLMVRNRTPHRWVYTYTSDKWWQKCVTLSGGRNPAVPHIFSKTAPLPGYGTYSWVCSTFELYINLVPICILPLLLLPEF